MADLARLVVALEAQTAKYQKGLDQANARLSKFERTQSKLLDKVNRGFSSVGRAARLFGASLTVGAVTTFTKRSAEFAENLDLMSSRLGVSAKELQAWQLIGERFGVQQTSLNTGIQRLTRRTAEAAKGMGEARGALRELGIDAVKFNNLSLDERMQVLAQAFSEVKNEGDKVRLAFKLFDTEGVGFLQFLNEGETGLAKLRGELEGQVWSDEERERLSKLNQQLTEISQTIQLTFAPALVSIGAAITNSIADAVKYLQNITTNYVRLIQASAGNQAALDKLTGNAGGGAPSSAPRIARTKIFREGDVNPFMDKGVNTAFDAANKAVSAEFKKQNDLLIARRELMREIMAPMVMTTQDSADAFDDVIFGKFDEMNAKAQAFQETFADNLVMAADSGFDAVLKSWTRTLLQMAARAASSKLFSLLGQGKSGGLFGALGGLFGGARASGGPVSAGRSYLVGEQGPELFMPRSAGNIIPNGGGVVVHQTLNVSGASRSDFLAGAAAMKEQTKAEIFDILRRSGR